jgi:glycosyltransferase involved in cell wall biosynthesis
MKITVFINNRNRVSTLKNLIDWLRDKNVEIVVLDNDSDYPPLIEYYNSVDCQVVRLGENMGNTALYKWGGYLDYPGRYFIYTDSDLLPREDCPKDLVEYLIFSKQKYQNFNKVGVSLEINDIPDFYHFKKEVTEWEAKFWIDEFDDFYVADVDTTFAAYDKSNQAGKKHCLSECLRTKRPYVMRHVPWYLDVGKLDKEEIYYLSSAKAILPNGRLVGMWSQKHKAFTRPSFF